MVSAYAAINCRKTAQYIHIPEKTHRAVYCRVKFDFWRNEWRRERRTNLLMSKDEQTRSESQDAVVNQRHAQRTPECPSEVIKDSKELTLAHSITTGID